MKQLPFPTGYTWTPWGSADHVTHKADGIVFVSTASHGGYILSGDKQKELELYFPSFQPFAGKPYYEEDCDASLIPLAFPQFFTDEELYFNFQAVVSFATMTGKCHQWSEVLCNLQQVVRDRLYDWKQAHRDDYERVSSRTQGDGWISEFRRIGDREPWQVFTEYYPHFMVYTYAQLIELRSPKQIAV